MGLFRSDIDWSKITVTIKDNKLVFTIQLQDEKKANFACGKIKRGKSKVSGMEYDEARDLLIYTVEPSTSFGIVAKQFEKMVK